LTKNPPGKKRAPPTAIVLPIFNEDVDRVFRLIEAMWIGLRKAAAAKDLIFSS
jgi:membrane glycosyltransferase